jgi:hypothetical protein
MFGESSDYSRRIYRMKESNVRNSVKEAMWERGWGAMHFTDARMVSCQHCHKMTLATPPIKGRSDLVAPHYTLNEPTAYVEVKDCKGTAFDFDEISPDQREYLDKHENSWIAIGRIVPLGSTKTTIHSIFVIPWKEWKLTEETITLLTGKKSLPYSYVLYEKKPIIQQPDLATRFKRYELEWGDGEWHFGEDHPLAVMKVKNPLHRRAAKEKETV